MSISHTAMRNATLPGKLDSYGSLSSGRRPRGWGSLLLLAIVSMFTIATPYPIYFGVPRTILIALAFVCYAIIAMSGVIYKKYICLAVALSLSFLPSILTNYGDGAVKVNTLLALCAMLVLFCFAGTYFEMWLSENNSGKVLKCLEVLLAVYFVVGIFEIIFYYQCFLLRAHLYGGLELIASGSGLGRDIAIYGGRPSGFFSEPSNFARFISVIVAAHMFLSRCSRRSLAIFIGMFLLVRSVTYFYAFPVMVVSLLDSFRSNRIEKGALLKINMLKVILALFGLVFISFSVYVTQSDRIQNVKAERDGSMALRYTYPIRYVLSHKQYWMFGYGPSSYDELAEFSVFEIASSGGGYNPQNKYYSAPSSTLMFLLGMGIVGIAIFIGALVFFFHGEWLSIAMAFFLPNILNTGLSTTTVFFSTALLFGVVFARKRMNSNLRLNRNE